MVTTTERKTADERRDEIIEAAVAEFALAGFAGTPTEAIAKRVGVSQPYLFRLFGTKKDLFLAAVHRCFRTTLEAFMRAAEGKQGEEALEAMGKAYLAWLSDRQRLLMQLQAHAACEDPEICDAVRRGFGSLVEFIERASGADEARVRDFVAFGMLLNIMASMDLLDERNEPWAKRLVDSCLGK
jgi:AcrR family transcriptional regulator